MMNCRILFSLKFLFFFCQTPFCSTSPRARKADRFKGIDCIHTGKDKLSCYATNEEFSHVFSWGVQLKYQPVSSPSLNFSIPSPSCGVVAGAGYGPRLAHDISGTSCFLHCKHDPCVSCNRMVQTYSGSKNGGLGESRFSRPTAVSILSSEHSKISGVLIADRDNQALRKLDLNQNEVSLIYQFKDNIVDVTSNNKGSKVFVALWRPEVEKFRIAQIDIHKKKIISTVRARRGSSEVNGLSLSDDNCTLLVCTNNPPILYVYDTCRVGNEINWKHAFNGLSCHAVTSPDAKTAYAIQRKPNQIHKISLEPFSYVSRSFPGKGGHGVSRVIQSKFVFVAATLSDAFFICDVKHWLSGKCKKLDLKN